MRAHPTTLSALLLLTLLAPHARADSERASYAFTFGDDATLGLWSVWETAQNEYLLTASLTPDASPLPIRLFNLEFSWDAGRLVPAGDPQPGALFEGQPEQWFGHYDSGATRTVTQTLLGDVGGVLPAGSVLLFSQLFHALDPAGGEAHIELVSLTLRDPDNQEISVTADDEVVLTLDVTPPQDYSFDISALVPPGNQTWTSQPLVASSLTPGDGSLADFVLNESAVPPANTDAAWTPPPAPATIVLSPGDGQKFVRAWLRDGYGNRLALPDSITLDSAAPLSHVTQLLARPRHQAVSLTWLNPVEDFDRVRLYRRGWSDDGATRYPEYDDIDPMSAYPESEAQALAAGFTLVYEGTGEACLDALAPRDVYRYAAFCLDAAGNAGPGHPEARDRSTNYYLGDTWTPWDGTVFVRDLVRLAGGYATAMGEPHYDPHLDYGPTDDHGREGIPLTDNLVGFEDLMILAMNYGPAGPVLEAPSPATPAALRLEREGEALVLRLESAPAWTRLHLLLRWDSPATATESTATGGARVCQSGPGRLTLDRERLPGEDATATLARLTFPGGLPPELRVAELELR